MPNSQSTSGTPRRTPPNGREQHPYDWEREQGEYEEEKNGDTSTQQPCEQQEGMRIASLNALEFHGNDYVLYNLNYDIYT